ncbi:MAG: hypothetical protein P9M14_05870 [Candidatus Alcyoniella australis]|nr:hypothetical protein [Candidatus Alcyoniella australis]
MGKRLIAVLCAALFVLCLGCAKQGEQPTAGVEQQMSAEPPDDLPPAPAQGTQLAQAAALTAISNGPSSPERKVLSQQPLQRPCWAMAEGYDRCNVDRPGHVIFIGTSSGAATREGAVLNAYQNAVEKLAVHCQGLSGDDSAAARELARARAYYYSGIYQDEFSLLDEDWSQQWQERFQDQMRVYHRAFVLLVVTEDLAKKITP